MPAVLLYCKIKNVLFFVFCFYVLCEKYYKPITVQYYIANCVSWVPRLTCWTYEQTGLMNVLLEWNSFVHRGFTVLTSWVKAMLPERQPSECALGQGGPAPAVLCASVL